MGGAGRRHRKVVFGVGVEEMEEVMARKGADELARTLEWCADRGRIEGLHPAEVRKAADLLREQAMKIEELSAILAANTPTVLFDERDGLAPYIKERRFTFIAVKPQAYQVETQAEAYLGYPVEVEARRAVSMFARQFEEAMMEQAMQAIAQTQDGDNQ